ncbi:hypothetical protein SOVF_206350 [Spinacia oleracea]|nr:hypothetical protein SOVF_206350 [Spinacia oleracea]
MAEISLRNFALFTFLISACFLCVVVNGRLSEDEVTLRVEEQLKSLMNSSMADRIKEAEKRNEQAAVEQPEEIMSMVQR